MTADEYQKDALRTAQDFKACTDDELAARLVQGAFGLMGETGECIDILKKYLFQGHPLDREAFAEELGDVCWYIAVLAASIGYSFDTVLQMNVEKREARYPEGFDAARSIGRSRIDI